MESCILSKRVHSTFVGLLLTLWSSFIVSFIFSYSWKIDLYFSLYVLGFIFLGTFLSAFFPSLPFHAVSVSFRQMGRGLCLWGAPMRGRRMRRPITSSTHRPDVTMPTPIRPPICTVRGKIPICIVIMFETLLKVLGTLCHSFFNSLTIGVYTFVGNLPD